MDSDVNESERTARRCVVSTARIPQGPQSSHSLISWPRPPPMWAYTNTHQVEHQLLVNAPMSRAISIRIVQCTNALSTCKNFTVLMITKWGILDNFYQHCIAYIMHESHQWEHWKYWCMCQSCYRSCQTCKFHFGMHWNSRNDLVQRLQPHLHCLWCPPTQCSHTSVHLRGVRRGWLATPMQSTAKRVCFYQKSFFMIGRVACLEILLFSAQKIIIL